MIVHLWNERINEQTNWRTEQSDHIITVNQRKRFSPCHCRPRVRMGKSAHCLTEIVSAAFYSHTGFFPFRLFHLHSESVGTVTATSGRGGVKESRLRPLWYDTHNATSLCLSRPLDVFFTLWMPSSAPDSVTLCARETTSRTEPIVEKERKIETPTLHPSPGPPRPEAAVDTGYLMPDGTWIPSRRRRSE